MLTTGGLKDEAQTVFNGKPDMHDYELFLAINDIDYSKTKVENPQSNGICERFHKTGYQIFNVSCFSKVRRQQRRCEADKTRFMIRL